jgi:hypothetical protein
MVAQVIFLPYELKVFGKRNVSLSTAESFMKFNTNRILVSLLAASIVIYTSYNNKYGKIFLGIMVILTFGRYFFSISEGA